MVKFSICIPNYNYSKYISETINSLLNQTYKNIEICISDNASTDKSIETIKKYTSEHKYIKLNVNKCNVGYYENLKSSFKLYAEVLTLIYFQNNLLAFPITALPS